MMARYNEGFFPAANLNPIFFRSWTPESPKTTVLCVHGTGGNSADYAVLAQRLADGDGGCAMKVVAFDSPANGYTQLNPGVSSFEIQRLIIEKFIEKASTPVALIASSGGAIATFMCLYLNRNKPRFNRIPVVFAEPSMGFDERTKSYMEQCGAFYARHYRSLDDAHRAWNLSPMGAVAFDDEEAKVAFIRGRLRVRGNALVPSTREMDPKSVKPFSVLNNKSSLGNPSLVLWGEKGGLKERYEQPLDRVLENQSKVEFPGAAHPLSLTRSVELDTISAFLRQRAVA